MYKSLGRHLPKRIREGFGSLLEYSSIKYDPDKFTGFIIFFGVLIAVLIGFLLQLIFIFPLLVFGSLLAIVYIVFVLVIYMSLWFSAESKSRFVEKILPDALNMMAVNIRSGLTTEKAFMLAARPEFGPLEIEMREAGKRIMSGEEVRSSLLKMPEKIKSDLFEKTIRLIVEGIESGGELARLLEETASDIERTRIIDAEIKANVLMYVIFIFFAAGIAVPVIYSISTNLVEVLIEQASKYDISSLASQASFGISVKSFGQVSVSPNFLIIFSLLSMVVTSIFAGLIIGVIKDGKEKSGAKYIPILLILSVALFFVTRILLAGFINI